MPEGSPSNGEEFTAYYEALDGPAPPDETKTHIFKKKPGLIEPPEEDVQEVWSKIRGEG